LACATLPEPGPIPRATAKPRSWMGHFAVLPPQIGLHGH
jgi:hypothetical protein